MHRSSHDSGPGQTLLCLLTGTVIGFACCFGAVTTRAQAPKTLKLGYILSAHSQLGAGAAVFADEIAKRTEGRYQIEQYPNSALGGEVEMLKAVQLGTVDLAFITGAPLPNFLPDIGIFNIPFLFRDVSHAHAVLDGPIGQSYLSHFRDKDLVALAWGENGMRHLTNSKRPVRLPEDLEGLKLRVPQSDVMLAGFKALGVDQQREVTRTIAQNAHEASSIAVEVVRAIASIEDATVTTKVEANQVLSAASQLSQQSDELHVEFDKFIAGVRAA